MTQLRKFLRASLLFGMLLTLPVAATTVTTGCDSASEGCCKVCDDGKACGDTCIDADDECHTSGGCACNG